MDDQAKANLLRDGIAAAQSGDREQAYRLFSQLTEDDYNNANAWIWLSAVTDDPDEALAAARNALAIEPNNEFAQQAERLALQAKEERSQGEPSPQQAMAQNAEGAVEAEAGETSAAATETSAAALAATEAPAVSATSAEQRGLLPPFLTQEMATQSEAAEAAVPPMATRPARGSFTSRLEARSAVQTDQRTVQAARRRQSLYSIGIPLLALVALGLIIYFGYQLIQGQKGVPVAQVEPTATPIATPTNLPGIVRVTQTVQAGLDATATASAQLLGATATAQIQAQQNANATFAAQTFPTTTPGPATLAYDQGLDAYNRKQYAAAATALQQAVQLDRSMVLGHYYLGLTDLALAQPTLGQSGANSSPISGTLATATPLSGAAPTSLPLTGTLTPVSLPLSGTLTPVSLPLSGTLTPASAPLSGTLTPSSSTATPPSSSTTSTGPTPTSADYYEQAAIAFRNVTSLAPNWAGGYAGLADTYLRQSRYQEALTPAQQAVSLDSGRPEYFLLLGRIYDGLGRSADAKAAYDAAAGLAPPIPGATPFPTPTSAPTVATATPAPAAATPQLLTTTPSTAEATATPTASEGGLLPTSAPETTPSATPQSAQPAAPAADTPTAAGFEVTVVIPPAP